MIMTICRYCGGKVPLGQSCRCSQSKEKSQEYHRDRHQRHKDAYEFYKSRDWVAVRDLVRRKYCGCDVYEFGETGQMIPARSPIVHHILPRKEYPDLELEESNLILLGFSNHELVEAAYAKDPISKKLMQEKLKLYQKKFEDYINHLFGGEIE